MPARAAAARWRPRDQKDGYKQSLAGDVLTDGRPVAEFKGKADETVWLPNEAVAKAGWNTQRPAPRATPRHRQRRKCAWCQ